MSIIQVLIILFALFAWSRVVVRLKGKDIGPAEFIFWSFIWLSLIILTIFQNLLGEISTVLGIGRAVDLAVYVSIILLFYLIFRIYVSIDRQNRDITKLVREIAIREAKRKK